jgi:lipopolysaccharide export system permease protein
VKTLDRYLAGIFIKNFAFALTGMLALFLFQALLGELLERLYPPNQVIVYNLLHIPEILVQMAPPAVLLATVLTLSGLSRTNELVACFAIGFGFRRIVALFLLLILLICCLMLIFQDRILPPTFKRRTTYKMREMEKKQDFFLDVKQDKIWYRSKNLIYNLQRFDQKANTIYGMAVYTFDPDFNLVQVIDAERAEFTAQGWKLMSGTVTTFQKNEDFPKTEAFEQKDLQIAEKPQDFREIDKEVKGLRLKELRQYIQRMKSAGADTKSYEVDFHSRISLSFIPFVMCFLGIPFSTRRRREGGMAKDLGFCLVVTFFYWLFYSVGLSLGTNGALAPWLAAWLPSAIFTGVAGVMISRQ